MGDFEVLPAWWLVIMHMNVHMLATLTAVITITVVIPAEPQEGTQDKSCADGDQRGDDEA